MHLCSHTIISKKPFAPFPLQTEAPTLVLGFPLWVWAGASAFSRHKDTHTHLQCRSTAWKNCRQKYLWYIHITHHGYMYIYNYIYGYLKVKIKKKIKARMSLHWNFGLWPLRLWDHVNFTLRLLSVELTSACGTAGISIVPGKGVDVIFQLVTHATCIYSLVIYVEGRESARFFFSLMLWVIFMKLFVLRNHKVVNSEI